MKKKIHIALVDDEELFLEGLSLLFEKDEGIQVSVKANDGLQFLELLEQIDPEKFPNVALVDIQMKPMDGFQLVDQLRQKYPTLKIIILSSHYKSNVLGHMIKLGVSGFIPKNANKELLFKAIQSIESCGVYLTPKDQEMLLEYMTSKSKKSSLSFHEELSQRETEVLKLICCENTNQEIANKLFISKRTVENHRQRITDKIGAKNTVGLVIYAIANKICCVD